MKSAPSPLLFSSEFCRSNEHHQDHKSHFEAAFQPLKRLEADNHSPWFFLTKSEIEMFNAYLANKPACCISKLQNMHPRREMERRRHQIALISALGMFFGDYERSCWQLNFEPDPFFKMFLRGEKAI